MEVSPQVDLDSGDVDEELVTCWADRHDRFNGAQRGAILASSGATQSATRGEEGRGVTDAHRSSFRVSQTEKNGLEHHPEHRFSDARRELTRAPSGATRGVDKGDEQRQSTWTTADGGRRQESSSTSSDASSRQSKNVLDKQDKRATAVTSTPKHQSSSLSGTQNASAARNSAAVATSDL